MLTKRDKILVRPWEQRKYENHVRKVQSALPVIDNKPPVSRDHVSNKLKKKQKEVERVSRIENDNLILLRKMNYIMRTNRVDNCWLKPLPNFLNRVAIHDKSKVDGVKAVFRYNNNDLRDSVGMDRKSRCSACNPKKISITHVVEERVPWEPTKMPQRRARSHSVPVRQNSLPTILEKNPKNKPKSTESIKKNRSFEVCEHSAQKLVLTRGSLKLSLNFPSDTQIKLQEGLHERVIVPGNCCCRLVK